jgi:hypothetical protein
VGRLAAKYQLSLFFCAAKHTRLSIKCRSGQWFLQTTCHILGLLTQQFQELPFIDGLGTQVALPLFAPHSGQLRTLVFGLDPFGDGLDVQLAGKGHDEVAPGKWSS